jgi:uncharacterized membrane protein
MATLLLAYIAFIPSVRTELPSLPYATLSDYIIYNYMICCLIPLLSETTLELHLPCRIIIFVLVLAPVVIIICLLCKYKLWKGLYDRKTEQKKTSSEKFNSNEWKNHDFVAVK